ncbi:2-phospho-L-lactate guanylyltransferase [Georgenia yuyongxinii]|uniref:2-phospho-L-lactate guanylyltransferase n=1 Tax=Georgenia yuyongxinii TaxID=2589797 RepID=UPI001E5D6365|nr:2-phospho-L-lactate guanylyltransferase [Georgenia yuyongxinii]
MAEREPVVAVVPLRDGRSGKTRLAGVLGADQRTRLVAVLARRVVDALLAAGPVTRVLVVTQDPDFAAGAVPADPRVEVVRQGRNRPGLNPAVALGHERARDGGARRVLVVHGDLPLLTAADVRALLAPTAAVVVAADRTGQGTNALVLDAGLTFAFRFGPGSRAAHQREADRLDLGAVVVDRPGTAMDLDSPADWAALPGAARDRLARAVGPAVAVGPAHH